MTTESIAIINKSGHVSEKETKLIARACHYQLKYHVAPAWDMTTRSVIVVSPNDKLPENTYPVYIFDDADQAGVLGYHDVTPEGLPYARVFVNPVLQSGGTILAGSSFSVASVVSHEVVELFVDLHANYWASDFQGTLYALEACDPVEADCYEIAVGRTSIPVLVSNFVYPEWFDSNYQGEKVDYLSTVRKPFTMAPGGYVIYEVEGRVKTRFAERYPEWRKATKTAASRTWRRQHIVAAPAPVPVKAPGFWTRVKAVFQPSLLEG